SSHNRGTRLRVWVSVGVRAPVTAVGAVGRRRGRGVSHAASNGRRPGWREPRADKSRTGDRGRRLARNRPQMGTAHLNQAKVRSPQRGGSVPATSDLGNEPPLSVDGETGIGVDRRRVSVQWFSGTILTGLCGAALMGGAVFASLDGETTFAESAQRFEPVRGVVDKVTSRKSNRLPAIGETNAARQQIPISTITKVGNREVVRKRTLVRVETNLSLSTTELSANIPSFNPQRMLADSDTNAANTEQTGAEPDAVVSFVTRDLAGVLPRVR